MFNDIFYVREIQEKNFARSKFYRVQITNVLWWPTHIHIKIGGVAWLSIRQPPNK